VKSLADTLVGSPVLASRSRVAFGCSSRSQSVPCYRAQIISLGITLGGHASRAPSVQIGG